MHLISLELAELVEAGLDGVDPEWSCSDERHVGVEDFLSLCNEIRR